PDPVSDPVPDPVLDAPLADSLAADTDLAPTLVPESAAVIAEDPAAPLLDLPAPMADVEVASAFDSPPASTEPVSVSPTVVPSIELTAAAEAETPTQE